MRLIAEISTSHNMLKVTLQITYYVIGTTAVADSKVFQHILE
jgi:hypothetical protein